MDEIGNVLPQMDNCSYKKFDLSTKKGSLQSDSESDSNMVQNSTEKFFSVCSARDHHELPPSDASLVIKCVDGNVNHQIFKLQNTSESNCALKHLSTKFLNDSLCDQSTMSMYQNDADGPHSVNMEISPLNVNLEQSKLDHGEVITSICASNENFEVCRALCDPIPMSCNPNENDRIHSVNVKISHLNVDLNQDKLNHGEVITSTCSSNKESSEEIHLTEKTTKTSVSEAVEFIGKNVCLQSESVSICSKGSPFNEASNLCSSTKTTEISSNASSFCEKEVESYDCQSLLNTANENFVMQLETKNTASDSSIKDIPECLEAVVSNKTSNETKQHIKLSSSSDQNENLDNQDPEWQIVKTLASDEERYISVRSTWGSLKVPNPNKNLTYHSFRKQRVNSQDENSDMLSAKSTANKRPAPHSPSKVNGKRQRTKTWPCTILLDNKADAADRKFKETTKKLKKKFDESMQSINQRYHTVQAESHGDFSNDITFGYSHDFHFGVPNWASSSNCNVMASNELEHEKNYLISELHNRLKQVQSQYDANRSNLKRTRDEVDKFYSFYKRDGEDPTLITHEEFCEMKKIDVMYDEYKKFYR